MSRSEDNAMVSFTLLIMLSIIIAASFYMLGESDGLDSGVQVQAEVFQVPDMPTGQEKYVQDYARVLSVQEKAQLVEISTRLEEQSGVQLVFMTNELSDPEEVKEIAMKLGNQWSVKGYVLAIGTPDFGTMNLEPTVFIANPSDATVGTMKATYEIGKNRVAPLVDEKKLGEALLVGGTAIGDMVRSDANLPGGSGDPNPTGEQPDWIDVHWRIIAIAGGILFGVFAALCVGCILEGKIIPEWRDRRERKRRKRAQVAQALLK